MRNILLGYILKPTGCTMRKRRAGHRKWGPRGQAVPGGHQGDIMVPSTRSRLMARIRGKDTSPERIIARALAEANFAKYEQHCQDLPGRPDFVFRTSRVAVFIDGDFWHGYRFPLWRHKLTSKWQDKIAATRVRDQRNFAKLRRAGWKVVRIWEHQVERNPAECVARIAHKITRCAAKGNAKAMPLQ